METAASTGVEFKEGMMASDLRDMTSIQYINSLRENKLITISRRGEIRLTERGKVASKLGVNNYLKLEKTEKQFLEIELESMKVENRGLLMIFGGMFLSLVMIIGFWVIQLKGL